MKTLSFTFNIEELNKVLGALSNLPYNQVADLITKIQIQSAPQLNPPAPPAEEPKDEPTEENAE